MRKLLVLVIATAMIVGIPTAFSATPKIGGACTKVNQFHESKSTVLVCATAKGKKTWRKATSVEKSLYLKEKARLAKAAAAKATPTPSVSPTPVPTASVTPTPVPTVSVTPTPTPTVSVTPTPTPTVSVTPTPTPTVGVTPTPTPTVGVTPTPTPTVSVTPTPTPTVSVTPTPTATPTSTATATREVVAPGVPEIKEIVPSLNSLAISWNPPSVTGGSPITRYTAYVATVEQTASWYCSTEGELSCTIGGLYANTEYTVVVAAWNSANGVNRSSGGSPGALVKTLSDGTTTPCIIKRCEQTIYFYAPTSWDRNRTPYALSATSTSRLNVNFTSNTLGICTVSAGLLTMVSEGDCSITASQSGSSSYLPAKSVTNVMKLSKGTQTITFSPTSTLRFDSGPYTLQASASSGLAVIFASNSSNVCSISGNLLTMISVGVCSISASQPGNGLFAAAPEVIQAINMIKNSQYLELANTGPGYFSAKTPFTVTAYSHYGFELNLINKTENVCTLVSPQRTDNSVFSKVESLVTMVKAGYCTITATVSGNEFYNSREITRSFLANMSGQTIDFYMPTTLNFTNFPYSLSATADSGLPVYYGVGSDSKACTLIGNTLVMVSAGYCFISVFQMGDLRFNPAPVESRTILVSKSAAVINIITPGLAAQQRGTPWVVETSDGVINLEATSSSGTQPYGISWTPNTCTFTGLTLNHLGGSLCQFNIYAPGNAFWSEAVSRALEISFRRI